MFTDIRVARKSALSLSKTLMVPTVVLAIGGDYAVIPADEVDPGDVVITHYDPFG